MISYNWLRSRVEVRDRRSRTENRSDSIGCAPQRQHFRGIRWRSAQMRSWRASRRVGRIVVMRIAPGRSTPSRNKGGPSNRTHGDVSQAVHHSRGRQNRQLPPRKWQGTAASTKRVPSIATVERPWRDLRATEPVRLEILQGSRSLPPQWRTWPGDRTRFKLLFRQIRLGCALGTSELGHSTPASSEYGRKSCLPRRARGEPRLTSGGCQLCGARQ